MNDSPSPISNSSDAVVVDTSDHSPAPSTHASMPPLEAFNALDALEEIVDFNPAGEQAAYNVTQLPISGGGNHGWGTGGSTWGTSWENAEREVSAQSGEPQPARSPKISSVEVKHGAWSDDEPRFIWRSDSTSDRHVTHFTRTDLDTILVPTGPERPSVLDNAPNDEWARTQLIKSLREAQRSHIPGPTFTLSQVACRLAEVQGKLTELRTQISQNESQIKTIERRQAALHAEANGLNDEVYGIRDHKYELERTVRSLVEVEKDLKDLQSIAQAYSP
ncbi:hypothetical protein PM082_006103 [Marasmius tenuissimus]|nr:hypothetical protein PM082_006103 [Marasmius tenuissimus]